MRNHTKTTGRALASFGIFRIALTLFATVILVALAGIACSSADDEEDTSNEPTTTAQTDEHVDDADEHADDADTHTDEADDHADDADTHTDEADDYADDADAHTDDADDADVTEVLISMTDQLTFEPNTIVAEAGHPIRLVFENTGSALHDFTIEDISVDHVHDEGSSTDMTHMDGDAHEYALHLALDGLGDGALEFTPEESGVYEFRCTVLGHAGAGMVGTLTVTEG
jgi:uncharacterized cupredoxin-like copper-binding protein